MLRPSRRVPLNAAAQICKGALRRPSVREAAEPPAGGAVVLVVDLHAEEGSADAPGGGESGAGAAERVEHQATGRAEPGDQRREDLDGFLGRVQPVAGVDPVDHVAQRRRRPAHVALGEQVGLLMPVLEEAGRGGVSLAEHHVADKPEAGGAPGRNEPIGLVPAVEAEAERTVLEDPVHLGRGGHEPAAVVVVGNRATCTVAVAHQVGRVREDEVDGRGVQPAH